MPILFVLGFPIAVLVYIGMRLFRLEAPWDWYHPDSRWRPVRQGMGESRYNRDYAFVIGSLSVPIIFVCWLIGWFITSLSTQAINGNWKPPHNTILVIASAALFFANLYNEKLRFWGARFVLTSTIFAIVMFYTVNLPKNALGRPLEPPFQEFFITCEATEMQLSLKDEGSSSGTSRGTYRIEQRIIREHNRICRDHDVNFIMNIYDFANEDDAKRYMDKVIADSIDEHGRQKTSSIRGSSYWVERLSTKKLPWFIDSVPDDVISYTSEQLPTMSKEVLDNPQGEGLEEFVYGEAGVEIDFRVGRYVGISSITRSPPIWHFRPEPGMGVGYDAYAAVGKSVDSVVVGLRSLN